jgi:transcriptional regulator with XRE-family HTH domain
LRIYKVLRVYRAFSGLKLKAMADEIGISAKQLACLEDDKVPSGEVMAKVVVWALGSDGPDLRHPAAVAADVIPRAMNLNQELDELEKEKK